MKYGYARSAIGNQESLKAQREMLMEYGVNDIIEESISGTVVWKPELTNLISKLEESDSLVVTSVDRLGRNTDTIKNVIDQLNIRKIKLEIIDIQ